MTETSGAKIRESFGKWKRLSRVGWGGGLEPGAVMNIQLNRTTNIQKKLDAIKCVNKVICYY